MSLAQVNQLPPNKHIYRRVLPQSCIAFASDEGKRLFKEALAAGHMECYFKLAAQFRTQDEPAFCGLTTMVMVLNALDMDPGRIWKGPWRWYHENMLDCCVPLEVVEQQGITFDQFLCVAACNSLEVQATRMVDGAMSVEEFRDIVKDYSQRDDAFMVPSYSRPVLDQTGDGHFSPIAGYHPNRDLILLLDTARFKYPPHWIPVQLMYDAMKALDQDTGKPRGLMLISPHQRKQHLLVFRLANNMSLTAPGRFSEEIVQFMLKWTEHLNRRTESLTNDALAIEVINSIIDLLVDIRKSVIILTTQLDNRCPEEMENQNKCVVYKLLQSLENTTLFSKVQEILKNISKEKLARLQSLFGNPSPCCSRSCQTYKEITCVHFLTIFILSWPYSSESWEGELTLGAKILNMVKYELKNEVLVSEVEAMRNQLKVLVRVGLSEKDYVGSCFNKREQCS